jgi:hypothetical protein
MIMSTAEQSQTISREWNGTLMTPEEFDHATDWDPEFSYELINGVLIVTPSPSPGERGPNDLLAHLLLEIPRRTSEGGALNATLPEHTLSVGDNRRRADRVIWCGFNRNVDMSIDVSEHCDRNGFRHPPEPQAGLPGETPGIPGDRRAGILDHGPVRAARRGHSVGRKGRVSVLAHRVRHAHNPLLPGFELALSRWLAEADRFSS